MTQATASHILVETEQECIELKNTIESQDNDTSFASAAKDKSKCPSGANGGELGSFGKGQMVKEFEDVVFDSSNEINKVYGPVKTQFGYHLITITSRA